MRVLLALALVLTACTAREAADATVEPVLRSEQMESPQRPAPVPLDLRTAAELGGLVEDASTLACDEEPSCYGYTGQTAAETARRMSMSVQEVAPGEYKLMNDNVTVSMHGSGPQYPFVIRHR